MKLTDWDMADNITSKDEVYAYLEAALEENNPETLFDVVGAIARSKGMSKIAKDLGLNRESLYKSLSKDGNPSFSTITKVLNILGYEVKIFPKKRIN